ncbi:hypothetical protein PHMEG_00026671 [Phytophthora megakarya]|uniref:Peptidase A2 domain-containing protein n=1 Tax=Phytophthora megakarya TaxID=4795 RepID=A0A225V8Q6_9STRA|nr:hypothetical protein PHMEG_00026671 [Phytophthora megakarya]
MTLIQDEISFPEQLYPEYQRSNKPDSGSSPAEAPVEVALGPGQRYGWWEDHGSEKSYEIATVCWTINDRRTRILLDMCASVSIVSLDLARRLSLKIRTHRQIKVSGLGGIPTYTSAHARVILPLIGNIGEGVDVLLGMNFMYSAGVRLCIRDGLVKLPDKENVVILYLRPGEAAVVKIEYGQTNPQREVVWAGRGKRWVTEILFGVRSWATAKCLDRHPDCPCLDCGLRNFPKEPGFVRPGKIRYKEWQRLILESTKSRQGRMRAERLEQLMRIRDPPRCHDQSTNGLPNSSPQDAEVRLVQLQERPEVVEVSLTARRGAAPKPEASALQVEGLTDVQVTTPVEETGAVDTRDAGTQVDFPSSCGYDVLDRCSSASDQPTKPGVRDKDSELSMTGATVRSTEDSERLRNVEDLRGDVATFSRAKDPECHPTLSPEHFASGTNDVSECVPEFDSEDALEDVIESALDDFSNPMDDASDLSDTPVQRLEQEYDRVMQVTVEELDLEPAVYLREGTELLAQLSDHLTMFLELEELSPECDIGKADVGVPGMEDKMRKILNYHRRIFLGAGNAAPAPARGVVCALNIGDAMPIALRARQIASRYLVIVYELLKKLLETGLIEHSESE